MRYPDESQSPSGYPSWPQFYSIASKIEVAIAGLTANVSDMRIGQGYLRDQISRDFARTHQRIDNLHRDQNASLGEFQERLTKMEATIEAKSQPPQRRSLFARLKGWAELIAPLRELLLVLTIIASGLAVLVRAPEVRVALDAMAAPLTMPAGE